MTGTSSALFLPIFNPFVSLSNHLPDRASGAELAIIVPAYKAEFLREALESIAAQTSRNFNLYVFDDGGPAAVEAIVNDFRGKLPLRYHRFRENLGGTSLVKHWERCLRLTDEAWVWIFSDDDMMEEGCVAAFHREFERTGGNHDAYRFNTLMVNNRGGRIKECARHPDEESGSHFLLERWQEKRESFMQELIFSRNAWKAARGIPDFPLAWHSDDAFAALLGLRHPVKNIPGPQLNWRYSRLNITCNESKKMMDEKIRATAQFIRWTLDYFEDHAKPETADAIEWSERWFFKYVARFWNFLGWQSCREIEELASGVWGYPRGRALWWGMKLNLNLGAEKIRRRTRGVLNSHAKNSLPHQPKP